jgi:hypothetical protein
MLLANGEKAANDHWAECPVGVADKPRKLQKAASERAQRDPVTALAVFTKTAKVQIPRTTCQTIFHSLTGQTLVTME